MQCTEWVDQYQWTEWVDQYEWVEQYQSTARTDPEHTSIQWVSTRKTLGGYSRISIGGYSRCIGVAPSSAEPSTVTLVAAYAVSVPHTA
eukprot:631100-Rhodomonas_salina.2